MSIPSNLRAKHDTGCNHTWVRRADLDSRRVLRFCCSRCDALGYRGLSPREAIRAYPDGRTRMPEYPNETEERTLSARQRFFQDRGAVQEWLERKAWNAMFDDAGVRP